ncbi:dihydropteroate synthase [Niveispirillum irakense]|uniref:dihydropteroate synthase n=1 Tax=Niveispirillum irakense TaxID=34011 RepID=UPI0004079C95|nr:dihydropteroate synthase [Niveispirillum irakense]
MPSDRLLPNHCFRPLGLIHGKAARRAVAAGHALPLQGEGIAFMGVERLDRQGDGRVTRHPVGLADFGMSAASSPFTTALPRWAGFDLTQPLVMGIVNVTPDSFSDGGDHANAEAAIAHGKALMAAGADILDVGGESTRPGAAPVPPAEEAARVAPVIRALAAAGAVISIDTRHALVMQAALEAGAHIINDVTGLTGDPDSLSVAASAGVPVVLMHMQGDPRTMQDDPCYDDVTMDVYRHLATLIARAEAAGIPRRLIALDPGIGFGKGLDHNVDLLADTAVFHGLGCPILIGVSRKRFIAALSRNELPKDRVAGSLAAGLYTMGQGAQIVRVHDVAATVQARAVWMALQMA